MKARIKQVGVFQPFAVEMTFETEHEARRVMEAAAACTLDWRGVDITMSEFNRALANSLEEALLS